MCDPKLEISSESQYSKLESDFNRKQDEMSSFFQTCLPTVKDHCAGNFCVKSFTPFKEPEKTFHNINWEIMKEKDTEEKLIKFCKQIEDKLPFMIPSNTTFASQIKIFRQLFKPRDVSIDMSPIISQREKDAWIGVYESHHKNQIIFLFWFSEHQYDFVWPVLKDIFTSIFSQ